MHKYTCSDCFKKTFLTEFAPMFDAPAFCPNCGKDENVTYHGEVNHAARFEAVADLLRKLYDIRKEPIKYALCDLSDWLEYELDKVMNQLDELQYEVENQVNEGE